MAGDTQGERYDAVVVGSGPNGLTAAITLARAGLSVLVLEAKDEIGGGCRTAELTLPGFRHDVCAAVHPMGVLSPAFREMKLERFGLDWIQPSVPLAHPLENGRAAILRSSLEETAQRLGVDGSRWKNILGPLVENGAAFFGEILNPIRIPARPSKG